MCLIVYSPEGTMIERRVFDYARMVNADGIGVMSSRGIEKFVGRKAGKRAWRYLRRLAEDGGVPYGVHFRWATHGAATLANCHPFEVPLSDACVMHNGVIRRCAKYATKDRSDTRIFVEHFMTAIPEPGSDRHELFFRKVEKWIGGDNLLLVYHRRSDQFSLANEDSGLWIGGVWYSNDYSLPWEMSPWNTAPACEMRSTKFAIAAAKQSQPKRSLTLSLMGSHHNDAALVDGRDYAYESPFKNPAPYLPNDYVGPFESEYADRNVSDAIDRTDVHAALKAEWDDIYGSEAYYAEVSTEDGYFDDGAEVGARAAMRAMLDDDDDRDFQTYMRRCGLPLDA